MKNVQQETRAVQIAHRAPGAAGYRSGVAARLAGLSAATLRVWERRYSLTATERSATGQRLYSASQVRRLGLLKQLVDQGHAIGTLAALSDERLHDMLDASAGAGAGPGGRLLSGQALAAAAVIEVAAIGAGLVRRLDAAIDDGLPLRLHGRASGLAHVEALGGAQQGTAASATVLLIELPEPDGTELDVLTNARVRSGAAAAVVLYRFCSSATVRALRARGFLVARFPAELGELPLLCRAALQRRAGVMPAAAAPRVRPVDSAAPARTAAARFDDVTLAAIGHGQGHGSGAGGHEDARMLADMLLQVGSFERYSARCADDSGASEGSAVDAQLHRHLELVSGEARLLLEGAMDRLLRQRR